MRIWIPLIVTGVAWLGLAGAAETQIVLDGKSVEPFGPEIEMLRMDLRAEKLGVVTENMKLSKEEAETFWPLYQEYDARLREIWNERLILISEYTALYPDVTEQDAARLISESLETDEEILKLRKKYYRKIKSALSATVAARFVQIERRIGNIIEIQIAQGIPMVE